MDQGDLCEMFIDCEIWNSSTGGLKSSLAQRWSVKKVSDGYKSCSQPTKCEKIYYAVVIYKIQIITHWSSVLEQGKRPQRVSLNSFDVAQYSMNLTEW